MKINELHKQFIDFYQSEWNSDLGYTISDFAQHFDIDIRLARYHLMKMVEDGHLAKLNCKTNDGVEVIYCTKSQSYIFDPLPNVKVLRR